MFHNLYTLQQCMNMNVYQYIMLYNKCHQLNTSDNLHAHSDIACTLTLESQYHTNSCRNFPRWKPLLASEKCSVLSGQLKCVWCNFFRLSYFCPLCDRSNLEIYFEKLEICRANSHLLHYSTEMSAMVVILLRLHYERSPCGSSKKNFKNTI